MKPFKAPTVVRRTPSNTQQAVAPAEPPAKKRRISHETEEDDKVESIAAAANILKQSKPTPKFVTPPLRKPLSGVQNPSSSLSSGSKEKQEGEGYYTVLWWENHPISVLILCFFKH